MLYCDPYRVHMLCCAGEAYGHIRLVHTPLAGGVRPGASRIHEPIAMGGVAPRMSAVACKNLLLSGLVHLQQATIESAKRQKMTRKHAGGSS